MSSFLGLYNYWIVIFLMMAGFYNVIARGNLIRKLIGLNIFQTSVFLLYISMGKVEGGTAPILAEGVTTVLQSTAPRPHPHRHCRRHRHHCGGVGAGWCASARPTEL